MKARRIFSLLCLGIAASCFVGCQISTEMEPPPKVNPARKLVINELFILPPPNPFAYHWIEFYNPDTARIRVSTWTLRYKTKSVFVATDTTGFILKAFSQDTVAKYYDVPFQSTTIVTRGTNVTRTSTNLSIPAYGFMTIVSDAERMKNFTAWGSEGGIRMDLGGQRYNGQPIIGFTNASFFRSDSTQIDSLVSQFYYFNFEASDQIVLKDSVGNPVDVLRYGNYVLTDPDPNYAFPRNRSLGPIVLYQSFARYAGAYTSGSGGNAADGSSADDFYVTGVGVPNTIPIPHWLSQAYKH